MSDATAKEAWDMFHKSIRLLDDICKRDGVTLKLKVPTLGAVKNKAKGLQRPASQSSGEVK